jgi:hypothetical protein
MFNENPTRRDDTDSDAPLRNGDAGIFYKEDRLAIFIDGANLYGAARSLGFEIDYKKLLKWGASKGRLVRAFYYTALIEDQEYSPIRPLSRSRPRNSPTRPAVARSRAIWISSWPSM